MPRSGPPVLRKNQTTIDIVTNWPMSEQISLALHYLNDYTLNDLRPYYEINFRRYAAGKPLIAK